MNVGEGVAVSLLEALEVRLLSEGSWSSFQFREHGGEKVDHCAHLLE